MSFSHFIPLKMSGRLSLTAHSQGSKKRPRTSNSDEEVPLHELVTFLPIEAALDWFREYLP